ncbi:MAG: agmatinase [Bacteroidota bacterium]
MIQLLGIPFDSNSSFLKGPALAPPRIRWMDQQGSANAFAENGTEILQGLTYRDLGDMDLAGASREQAFRKIKAQAAAVIADGNHLLSIGGDHSVSYPLVSAFAERFPGLHILHLDAHADLYEDFEGNPYSHASPFARILESSAVDSLTQVGIRTLNTHQREQAQRFGVQLVEMKSYSTAFLKDLKGPLYISLDLDVLDPAFAPGVSHHEPGGLSTRQVLDLLQGIDVNVVGADMVEYNPVRDVHDMTAMVGYKMMKELMALMST